MGAMKITKSQKVYFGLLAAGLVALGVDRFVLSPQTAAAADNAQSLLIKPGDSVTASGNVLSSSSTVTSLKTNPVADKLKRLNDSVPAAKGDLRDAFTPGAAWVSAVGGDSSAPNGVANFSQTHHLTGVLVSGRTGQAMIDGKLILMGQTVDSYKLIAVKTGIAIFEAGDVQVTLRIAKDQ
jgi:hypothetical protein